MKHKLKITFFLLSVLCFLLSALNAQIDENIILDSISIQKNELIITPEIEEMLVYSLHRGFINLPDESLLRYGITNRSQLKNLHPEKTIPEYWIVNDSLRFSGRWEVPMMLDGEPLFTINVGQPDYDERFFGWIPGGSNAHTEAIHNYEHKNLIIGFLRIPCSPGKLMDCIIIKKENQVLFVEINDEATGESFKNEYSFSELINLKKEGATKAKEARNRYFAQVANKSELIITPEIEEMVVSNVYSSLIDVDEENLPNYGIKSKALLENLHLEKPIPVYNINIENDSLKFSGSWKILVMSVDEPLFYARIHIEEDGQYSKGGWGDATLAINIPNYEHKNLIIGYLDYPSKQCLIIRKDNKNIFVEVDKYDKSEYFKNEYNFSELINLLKKKN